MAGARDDGSAEGADRKAVRDRRRANALRANLKRRKAQMRQRRAVEQKDRPDS